MPDKIIYNTRPKSRDDIKWEQTSQITFGKFQCLMAVYIFLTLWSFIFHSSALTLHWHCRPVFKLTGASGSLNLSLSLHCSLWNIHSGLRTTCFWKWDRLNKLAFWRSSSSNITLLILSSSGSSLTSWLTPGQVYEKSREDPEIGFVMGWSTTTTHQTAFFEL